MTADRKGHTMRIVNALRPVLEQAQCEGPIVRFPPEHLFPAPWDRLERVLTAAGASWSYRHRAYVFADLFPHGDVEPLIASMLDQSRTVRPPQRGVVSCPQAVAERMCDELPLQVQHGDRVLEPSAGHGVLAAEAAARGGLVDCHELENWRAEEIRKAGFAHRVTTGDFLKATPQALYDQVLMYPPYRRDLAAQHIVHAYRFLRPGGMLAALVGLGMSNGVRKASQELRELWESAGSFKADLEHGDIQSPTGLPLSAEIWFLEVPERH